MKKIVLTVIFASCVFGAHAQDFSKNLVEARTAYTAGNLQDSRFALEQMLHEIDRAIGKEILKLLPGKMDAMTAQTKEDQVTGGGTGAVAGLFVQRSYGSDPKSATLDIMNNSPLINSLNTLLSIPFVAAAAKDENQKILKIQGYKAILTKSQDTEAGKTNYELQIPLQNTLVSFKVNDTKEADMVRLAGTIPLQKIAQLAN